MPAAENGTKYHRGKHDLLSKIPLKTSVQEGLKSKPDLEASFDTYNGGCEPVSPPDAKINMTC